MHIVVIGGREKNEVELARIATSGGHTIECHHGGVAGTGIGCIRSAVGRASLVVIVTEINSHGGVQAAKWEAQRWKKPTLVVSRLSGARLRALLQAAAEREDRRQRQGAATARGGRSNGWLGSSIV